MHILLIMAVFLVSAGDAQATTLGNVSVDVWISDTLTPAKLLQSNKMLVTSIFQGIGIEIRWHAGHRQAVRAATSSPVFEIGVVERAPASAPPEALASTRLAGPAITIFQDRMRRRLRQAHPAAAKVALAYVIAHELAHAMQGIDRHSQSGILKSQWSNDDFTAMLFGSLAFTPTDVDLIRKGLNVRIGSK